MLADLGNEFVRPFRHQHMARPGQYHESGAGDGRGKHTGALERRHQVQFAGNDQSRHRNRRARCHAIRVGVAGRQILVEDAGTRAFENPLANAYHPQARRRVGADPGARAVAPEVNHVDGLMAVVPGRAEQCRTDRHRRRRPDQHQSRDARGMACRALERDQGSHRMSDQRRTLDRRRIEQADDPVGKRRDRLEWRTARPTVARQIDREDIDPAKSQPAALQRPDRVVHAGAVQEDHDRLSGAMILPAGRDVDWSAVDFKLKLHDPLPRRASPLAAPARGRQ